MSSILEKISSYNIFNYLFPGAVFVFACEASDIFKIASDNVILALIIYYFAGMTISRIGSMILDPILMRLGWIKFSHYSDYLRATEKDAKTALWMTSRLLPLGGTLPLQPRRTLLVTKEQVLAAAEAQAAQDQALADALKSRDGEIVTPQRKPNPTIGDNFIGAAELIAAAKKKLHLQEQTLVKVLELQMMWALNNRQTTQQTIFDDTESGGGEPQEDEGLPEPNEVITAAEGEE